jgi:hypothetical protein
MIKDAKCKTICCDLCGLQSPIVGVNDPRWEAPGADHYQYRLSMLDRIEAVAKKVGFIRVSAPTADELVGCAPETVFARRVNRTKHVCRTCVVSMTSGNKTRAKEPKIKKESE